MLLIVSRRRRAKLEVLLKQHLARVAEELLPVRTPEDVQCIGHDIGLQAPISTQYKWAPSKACRTACGVVAQGREARGKWPNPDGPTPMLMSKVPYISDWKAWSNSSELTIPSLSSSSDPSSCVMIAACCTGPISPMVSATMASSAVCGSWPEAGDSAKPTTACMGEIIILPLQCTPHITKSLQLSREFRNYTPFHGG